MVTLTILNKNSNCEPLPDSLVDIWHCDPAGVYSGYESESSAGEKWLRGTKGITVLKGHARFVSPNGLCIGNENLTAKQIFLDVGGRPLVPKMPGLDQVPYLTNSSMMDVDFLPEHLMIVGGSCCRLNSLAGCSTLLSIQ